MQSDLVKTVVQELFGALKIILLAECGLFHHLTQPKEAARDYIP
jgi:hypothetical protein